MIRQAEAESAVAAKGDVVDGTFAFVAWSLEFAGGGLCQDFLYSRAGLREEIT